MVRVGIVLSGCGYLDGAEIHESVLAAYFLERAGAEVAWLAPNVEQMHVVDHVTGEAVPGQSRNVLVESARIARGDISAVDAVRVESLDALVLPGGYGAAKNLSDFAVKGAACQVHPAVAGLLRAVHAAGKPIGAICIAPAVVAKVLGPQGPELTIGDDPLTAKALVALGARHAERGVREVVVDRRTRIVSTPAYMLGPRISDVAAGIEALCQQVVALAKSRPVKSPA